MNPWLWLLIAGIFEVQWAVTMKYTEGFTKLWPSIFCVAGMVVSFYALAMSQKTLALSTSYAVWVGIGIIGSVIFGILLFDEAKTWLRFGCIALIVIGIFGLKLTSQAA